MFWGETAGKLAGNPNITTKILRLPSAFKKQQAYHHDGNSRNLLNERRIFDKPSQPPTTPVIMSLEKLELEHIPPSHQVYTAFFRDVANTEFLHKQLLSRNREFEYAFIDASSVISRLHLLSAVYSAVNILLDGTLRTPNVHSEIVVSLNINNNVRSQLSPITPDPMLTHSPQIADAYRRWGISPGKTKDLLVVKVVFPPSTTQDGNPTQPQSQTQQAIWEHLTQHVKGTPSPLTDDEIAKATDWPKVRKYYRLNGVPVLDGAADEKERWRQSERLAIMGMALRGL